MQHAQKRAKFGSAVSEICARTDRQTYFAFLLMGRSKHSIAVMYREGWSGGCICLNITL